jgi:ubiquinone/menaquinone biosynthesis C-methylase UbiE
MLMCLALMSLAACDRAPPAPPTAQHKQQINGFPAADRPVATIMSSRWSNEDARDRVNEAQEVMDRSGIGEGMTVADIGAGEGYYTIRLSPRVGRTGRVLAEDIVPETRDKLATRVARDNLENVSVRLGLPADPRLPENSFDRVLLIHMYHEIESPYEFLWRLRPSLKREGMVVVVDADRPTQNHGTPPELLKCEFAAVGFTQVALHRMPSAGGYLALFKVAGDRPEPGTIKPCKGPTAPQPEQ